MGTIDLQTFILSNIYVLLIVNIGLLLTIYIRIFKSRIREKMNNNIRAELSLAIAHYLVNRNFNDLKLIVKNKNRKLIAIDIINEQSESTNDRRELITKLELDTFLIHLTKRKENLNYLRKLAFMKVPTAYDVLLHHTHSSDIEVQYISFFGLLLMDIQNIRKYHIVHQLIKTNIYSDRIIEILEKSNLHIEDWIELLENEDSDIGKIIILKILAEQEEIVMQQYSDRILKYLDAAKEIKIAAITALCSSKNEEYLEKLYDLYMKEDMWEVRATITKGMVNFDAKRTKEMLLLMIKDKEWWVRFNAARTISLMGEEGIYTLIDLSIDKSNENTAALAYYFLNSNKDIYETVKKLED